MECDMWGCRGQRVSGSRGYVGKLSRGAWPHKCLLTLCTHLMQGLVLSFSAHLGLAHVFLAAFPGCHLFLCPFVS